MSSPAETEANGLTAEDRRRADDGDSSSDDETQRRDGNGDNDMSTAERIWYILAGDDDDEQPINLGQHPLFTQMDVLCHFEGGRIGWKEISRWLKYEETVETGDRWSKPYVSTTTIHGLQALRKALVDGKCAVSTGNSPTAGQYPVADAVVKTLKNETKLSDETCRRIRDVIIAPHKHKDRKAGKKYSTESSSGQRQKKLAKREGEGIDVAKALYQYPPGATPTNLAPYKPNKRLTKKLPKKCEAANLLVGQVDFLQETVMAFCRLDPPSVMTDLTEVEVPTRFIFIVLSPTNAPANQIWENTEMARSLAALLADKVFVEVAYKAKDAKDLVAGIEEYTDGLLVLPPSVWDPSTRLQPPNKTASTAKVMLRLDESTRGPAGPKAEPQEEGASSDQTLNRTGKFCGGLIRDVKNRYSLYLSDIKDGLHVQCVASTIFLFFACITPIVTFGGLMGQKTDGYMGTMETLLSGAICGILYALFAGQPLTIVGATGPLLVFESILYHLCHENNMDFMAFRFWIGVWVMVALLIIVALDLSALVQYITRFTEEAFSILISIIFIYEAFTKIYEIAYKAPIHTGIVRELPDQPSLYHCHCIPVPPMPGAFNASFNATFDRLGVTGPMDSLIPVVNLTSAVGKSFNWTYKFNENCITYKDRLIVSRSCISEAKCLKLGWNLTGAACHQYHITMSVPDVFFMSLILFLGTFALAYTFRLFRTSRYFPSRVRSTVADFAVFLSVLIWTLIDNGFGLPTPKLNVPAEFKPTRPDRGWIVNPGGVMPHWYLIPLSILPALLCTILVFLDQQITAVIVNRKEHKFKKPHGYHLDLFVIAISIFICSLLGLPWFVAATVRAITHVRSLMVESEVKIPGERPQLIGAREQRVTGFFIHLFIGLSTLITGVLRLIPMPVLYGVFLYMGITSLAGVQFFERVQILFMPVKFQPDYIYLRHCKTLRVHLFTLFQLTCFIAMWFVKQIKTSSIAFPLMLVALMAVRKGLDYVFTQSELYWLDHLLPGEDLIKLEDEDEEHAVAGHGTRHGDGALRHRKPNGDSSNNAAEADTFLTKEQEALGQYSSKSHC